MDNILKLIGTTVETSPLFGQPPYRKVKLVSYKKEQPSFLVQDKDGCEWVDVIYVN